MMTTTSHNVKDIIDYASLKKVASALWKQDNSYHGAAIMVGAGFSRCAAKTGDEKKKLPLWNTLASLLAEELGIKEVSDPLRLAEEYRAFFGNQAMHDVLKKTINDTSWVPGNLFHELLSLPWSEVLTTNWDTLLERASEDVHSPVYNLVTKQSDLSSAKSPRIVKLHGTLSVTENLVFTQEDYRRYPETHAAFVNFSRQVFIENELCLLGFSGDDPNFLQWAGWVRDHLENNARRIYLVGALNLNAAKRKYLESINISPIDLYDLVSNIDDTDVRHFEATNLFLQALHALKPRSEWEWDIQKDHEHSSYKENSNSMERDPKKSALLVQKQIPYLIDDRNSYPGWLVCPYIHQLNLRYQLSSPHPSPAISDEMDEYTRSAFINEFIWRHSLTYNRIPDWVIKISIDYFKNDKFKSLNQTQKDDLLLLLYKNIIYRDEIHPASIELEEICKEKSRATSEFKFEVSYISAIISLRKLEISKLEEKINSLSPLLPIEKMKKSALLCEIGDYEKAKSLLNEAYKELLKQFRKDQNSIKLLSKLSWCQWLLQSSDYTNFNEFDRTMSLTSLTDKNCNPWDYVENIKKKIEEDIINQEKSLTIKLDFKPGIYNDVSNPDNFLAQDHPVYLFEGMVNEVGIPLRINYVNMFSSTAEKILELNNLNCNYKFSLAIRCSTIESSDVLNTVFSRINMPKYDLNDIKKLIVTCKENIEYWSNNSKITSKSLIATKMRVLLEVLSRCVIRVDEAEVKEIFQFACSIVNNVKVRHFWIYKSLGNLLNNSISSIREELHYDLLPNALNIPLAVEISEDFYEWPNPVIKKPGVRTEDGQITRRIGQIIDSITGDSKKDSSALIRLIPLIECGYLTHIEMNNLSSRIWGDNPTYEEVPELGLFNFAFFTLPSKNNDEKDKLLRNLCFTSGEDKNVIKYGFLNNLVGAASLQNGAVTPTPAQAQSLMLKLLDWRLDSSKERIGDFFFNEDKRLSSTLSLALAKSIIPSLSKENFTEQNFNKCMDVFNYNKSPEILLALPYFISISKDVDDRIENVIKNSLIHPNSKYVAYAGLALVKCFEICESHPLIKKLITRLLFLIESARFTGLNTLLNCAKTLIEKEKLSPDSIESLVQTLPMLYERFDYSIISTQSKEAASASLIRASCVEIAFLMISDDAHKSNAELAQLIEKGKSDPLPEVRLAAHDF
ncbi:SIR2 family NAD-dependent protein deacylase [Candidatus Pantoea formicae]|uniref:SIR2 family NAD-dependent protein deacylase n=1 Tax=Candidatus Pantoea formicae TaxID=2608355 RepID=UPI003ED8892E